MFRIRFLILMMAVTVPAWTECQAVGSFKRPDPRPLVTAGIAPPLPTITLPVVSARDFAGCGRGRIRDTQTHGCRGPADLR
jgi:hypothetical protein